MNASAFTVSRRDALRGVLAVDDIVEHHDRRRPALPKYLEARRISQQPLAAGIQQVGEFFRKHC